MPAASSRSTWKGAISFGLVHIPVELRSATAESRQSFKWIDSKTASAVGNQQINKVTGEAIDPSQVVKGLEYDEGRFVTLTKEEIRAALPKTTQTIEIEAFVDVDSIPYGYFQRPYHVAPLGKGQKAYALLRDTLKKTHKAGLARVVISTKQHFSALMPEGDGMVLNLLRWSDEVRDMNGLALPDSSVKPTDKELKMAEMLVEDLAAQWSPGLFHDEFKEQLKELVEEKARSGNLITVAGAKSEGEAERSSADVLDLTELLQRSLQPRETKPARKKPGAANDGNVRVLRPAASGKAPSSAQATVKPQARRKKG